MLSFSKTLVAFHSYFKKHSDKEYAIGAKSYLKSSLKFYGVRMNNVTTLAREFKKVNSDLTKAELWKLVISFWKGEYYEDRVIAMRLLEVYEKMLQTPDFARVEKLLRSSTNWDQIDLISTKIIAPILMRDSEKNSKAFAYLKKWSADTNFWIRRASLISQLPLFRKDRGDIQLFFSFAEKMLHEKEFFIRKAIGWVLRDLSQHDPEKVFRFMKKNLPKMSGLTFREGSRKLPEKLQKQLRA